MRFSGLTTPSARPARSRTPSESDIRSALSSPAPPVTVVLVRLVCFPYCFLDSGANVRSHEYIDQLWVELGAASFLDGAHRLADAASMAVASSVGYSVEAVGNRDHE